MKRKLVAGLMVGGGLGFYLLVCLFPVYWMVVTSLKRNPDLYDRSVSPFTFNMSPTTEHYEYLFEKTLFLQWLTNTLIVGILVVILTLLLSVPAAYGLTRLRFRGREGIGAGFFIAYLVPPTLLFVPMARIISVLNLQDSRWALVLTYPTFTVPFCTWLLIGFIRNVPYEVEEAAFIDGCGRFGAVRRVVLPLILPGVITAGVFALTATLQEFIYALSFISSSPEKTVILGVTTDLVRGDVFFWGSLMSGAVVTAIPVFIAYTVLLKHFVTGFTKGALR